MEIILNLSNELLVSEQDKLLIDEYMEHDEWGLAFEILCASLYERDIHLTDEQFNKIQNIGLQMEMDASLWNTIPRLFK